MSRAILLFPLFLTLVGLLPPPFAQAGQINQESVCACGKHLLPQPTQKKPGRKYARDRLVDILHLSLDVTPDFTTRTIAGSATLSFQPIARPLSQLELDAIDLGIASVQVQGAKLLGHTVTDEKLVLNFEPPVPPGATATVSITYRAQPQRGLYFRTPEMGYKAGDTQLWTQGEPELHRFWFPCYDYPNERFTSEIFCHLPEGMKAVSNGVLVSSDQKNPAGLVRWHWRQNQPHVNYLVALAAGYFHTLTDRAGPLPLALHVPPSEAAQAESAFQDTAAVIRFLERETGTPFPWDKYDQVYCLDFLAGGMENTSCSFMAAGLLFKKETGALTSLHWLDAHESTHQWFGNLVTCRDWSHLWLNEGFASYYTALYDGEKFGPDDLHYSLWREARKVIDRLDSRPIVWRDYQDPMEQFDYRAYPKGAWVLRMIHSRLGDDLYREAIQVYLQRHRNTVVGTDDLQDVLEEVSGLSFDRFFDQWLYHGGLPELKVDFAWDAATKLARLTLRQTQKISPQVPVFHFDLPVHFYLKGSEQPVVFQANVTKQEEDFYFPLPSAPDLLRLDPGSTLLANIDFTPPPDMLQRQLDSDMLGRLLAVRVLGKKKDDASVAALAGLLNTDPFHGVRTEAAKSLQTVGTPAARQALAAGLDVDQPDARTRLAVVEALASFPHPDAQATLFKAAATEPNPRILAAIIRSWGARPADPNVSAALRRQLQSTSYRNVLAAAAISALRSQNDDTAVPLILKKLQSPPDALEFSSRDLATAMDDLAFLAHDLPAPQREPVRLFLASHLTHPKEDLRVAAATALGTLRDPRSIALLKPLAALGKLAQDPAREAAAKSLTALQAELPRPQELKAVWTQMQVLQDKARELEKQLETMKKKTEAAKP